MRLEQPFCPNTMMIRGLVLLLSGLPRAAHGQGCTMLNLGAHVTNINSAVRLPSIFQLPLRAQQLPGVLRGVVLHHGPRAVECRLSLRALLAPAGCSGLTRRPRWAQCCAGGCDGNGMPADCSLSCAGPFLQFAQECQSIIAAMPIAGELNALVDKCHAAGGVASGGCPCGDVAQKAEVDSLRERLANRDATIDHLSGLLQMVGERMEGVEARVHLLEMEESQLGQNHCLARVNPDDPTAPSTMSGTNGDIDAYCTDECPCGEGEGDCDTSSQCAGGLVCEEEHVLRVGRACPSWMRPDAECCYNIGHASGRDQCAGLSEGAPCDDANAVSCSSLQPGVSFPRASISSVVAGRRLPTTNATRGSVVAGSPSRRSSRASSRRRHGSLAKPSATRSSPTWARTMADGLGLTWRTAATVSRTAASRHSAHTVC